MKSLFSRVYVLSLILLFSAFLSIYLFTHLTIKNSVHQEISSSLNILWRSVAYLIKEEGKFQYDEEVMINFRKGSGNYLKILEDNKYIELQPDKSVINFPSENGLFFFEINGKEYAGYGEKYGRYYILVYREISNQQAMLRKFSKNFFTGWLAILVVYTLIAYPLWYLSFRVVMRLAKKIEESSPAKLDILDENVFSEIKPIVKAYNQLVNQLNNYLDTQKFFFYHLSHELKTPLSIIRTSTDLTLRKPRSQAEMREFLLSIKSAAERASQVVEKLLLLYRLETQNVEPKREIVELKTLILGILGDFKQLINNKNLSFEIFEDEFKVFGDYELIHSLFSNIIENAIKYSPQNGKIGIKKDSYCVIIEDEGIGISKEELIKIFEPFYRSEKAKLEEGSGLGLSICKVISKILGWELTIHSEVGRGTSVKICTKSY